MVKILLMCNAGMSTSLLVNKMSEYAVSTGYNCEINAQSSMSAIREKIDADIILLGPQIRHQLKQIQKIAHPIPVHTIDTVCYGMMDGKKVIQFVQQVLSSKV